MSATYSTLITRALWEQRDSLTWPACMKVTAWPEDAAERPVVRVTVCDTEAPDWMAGMLVDLAFTKHADGRVTVAERRAIHTKQSPPFCAFCADRDPTLLHECVCAWHCGAYGCAPADAAPLSPSRDWPVEAHRGP